MSSDEDQMPENEDGGTIPLADYLRGESEPQPDQSRGAEPAPAEPQPAEPASAEEPAPASAAGAAPADQPPGAETPAETAAPEPPSEAQPAAEAAPAPPAAQEEQPAAQNESMAGTQLDERAYRCAVEALLFSTDKPLGAGKIADILGAGDGRTVRQAVKTLQQEYEAGGRAFQIEEIAGGFQIFTLPEYHPYVMRLGKAVKEEKVSQAALETLAIIAYRQPILRADIESIRGVQCGPILRALIERGLVKVVGKSEELGRPLLYGTTRKFLEVFGLKSVSDLPQAAELLRRPEPGAATEESSERVKTENPPAPEAAEGGSET